MTAEHREAIWDEGSFHPGYGKGVCEFDGEPWPCKHWEPEKKAREALVESIQEAWHSANMADECWIDYELVAKGLRARGYVIVRRIRKSYIRVERSGPEPAPWSVDGNS